VNGKFMIRKKKPYRLLGQVLLVFIYVWNTDSGFSQSSASLIPQSDSPKFFFDARSSGISKDGSEQIFDGDVIAIGPQSLIVADKVVISEKSKTVSASGHVIVLSNGQFMTGTHIQLNTESGDLRVDDAIFVVNDQKEAEKIANDILGFSSSELIFETQRKKRIEELNILKSNARLEARKFAQSGKSIDDQTVTSYALLLEQEELIKNQENPAFAQMSEARRQTIKRRREFWEQAKLQQRVQVSGASSTSYFRLSGDKILKVRGNDLISENGVWTPCRCELDEEPAWGLRSTEIFAQPGGYATFKDAVVEIKGFPVLYLPWFRIPIKDQRQSGLDMPSVSDNRQAGTIFSQPLFLDLGKSQDLTLKGELFEKRGFKLGVESRTAFSKVSGLNLSLDVMRDRLWLEQRATRLDLFSSLMESNSVCQQGSLQERDECVAALYSKTRTSDYTTRGALGWGGRYQLSDRVSLVSVGEIITDRQFNSDLFVPGAFNPGFDTGTSEKAVQTSSFKLHYDGQSVFSSIGTRFYDNLRSNDLFEGYQTPLDARTQTRFFDLFDLGPVPVYGRIATQHLKIQRHRSKGNDLDSLASFIPGGWWQRFDSTLLMPLPIRGVFKVDGLAQTELRHIVSDEYKSKSPQSYIASSRFELRLQLPIDGKSKLPEFFGGIESETSTKVVHHSMNWMLSFSARPYVQRRGPYGNESDVFSNFLPKTFFVSDQENGVLDNMRLQDSMSKHQLLTLSTTHRWKVYSESWKRTSLTDKRSAEMVNDRDKMSWFELAKLELQSSSDQRIGRIEDLISQNSQEIVAPRYKLVPGDFEEPVNFKASISYDFFKANSRRNEEKTVANRPWTDIESSVMFLIQNWSLNSDGKYSIYDKKPVKLSVSLSPPGLYESGLTLNYVAENVPYVVDGGSVAFAASRESTAVISSSFLDPLGLTYSYSKRFLSNQ
jgi:hypothetical protein